MAKIIKNISKKTVPFATVLLTFGALPYSAAADGVQDEINKSAYLYGIYFIGWVILFLAFFALYFISRKPGGEGGASAGRKRLLYRWGWIISLAGALITGAFFIPELSNLKPAPQKPELVEADILKHVHGLGFSPDGKQLLIPSHYGLAVYENHQWKQGQGDRHDYMGFAAVDNGFYSSGHPADGSGLKEPLGIVKSTDNGKSLKVMDLHGISDFHVLAAGYQSHAIYVYNPQPNSRMDSEGLYYTLDEAKTWNQSAMQGVSGTPFTLAVHPSKASIVAAGNQNGAYLSNDHGQSFAPIAKDIHTSAVYFSLEGQLYIGGIKGEQSVLFRLDPDSTELKKLGIPAMTNDAIVYIAENPKNPEQLAIATFERDVYLSNDRGATWEKIADKGKKAN
ncbi:F510_1955 family glycosylhydrolase [Ferviditalea candida]|uniref:Glycosyl hydrolase n=1 Tax=Ferviditalea candida TaxID=3108399 RepID=A0ABU5ZLI7_9BACL|nr:glycosyl hydrolase [Paenibacillaceae bacterium T2]